NNKWHFMPNLLILPLLASGHWRCVRIKINYIEKKASILYSDPYGQESFSDELILKLEPKLRETINKLISAYLAAEYTLPENRIITYKKTFDQQGQEVNGYDCGPIRFKNIEYYTKI